MKRLVYDVFQFTEEQLWGPSEARNARDTRYSPIERWEHARQRLFMFAEGWLLDVLSDLDDAPLREAWVKLTEWFQRCYEHYRDDTDSNPTPRYVLQTLGTEWGRSIRPSVWNEYAIRAARKLLGGGYRYERTKGLVADEGYAGPGAVIVTDGRFKNEVLGVKALNGAAMLIQPATNVDASATERAGVAGHASEAEQKSIPKHFYDLVIENDKSYGLLALENVMNRAATLIAPQPTHLSTGKWFSRA